MKAFEILVETVNDEGERHSFNDKPAVEWDDGDKEWYKEGELHRLDGPAMDCSNGDEAWYKEGLYHRLDGPAVTWCDGAKEWDTKEWYKEDKRHRADGPAVEYGKDNNGKKEWYYEGKKIECSSTEEFLRIINLKVFW